MHDIAAGRVPGAEHCDIDSAYQAIAWLLSPAKREEQRRMAVFLKDGTPPNFSGIQMDLLLTAIEGRVPDEQREPAIEFGLGEAGVFGASSVQEIDRVFKAVTHQQFGQYFSPTEMAEQGVEPEIWDEGPGLLEEFLRPAFERLRGFFARAAEAKQNVVVVYT